MRIIAVTNQKGGTGKTTSAWAIITGAAARGRKVLGIDFDPQGNLTFMMNADANKASVLQGAEIQHTAAGDIIAAGMDIAGVTDTKALEAVIKPLRGLYDLIVIDCPPTLGKPLICALWAATEALIPVQADPLSIQGLYQMRVTIDQVNEKRAITRPARPPMSITGAFLTRHSARSIISRNMADAIQERCAALHIPFIDTPIREGVAIKEAQTMQESLFTYAPKSKPAADYMALLDALKI